jgi:hypothetical protein
MVIAALYWLSRSVRSAHAFCVVLGSFPFRNRNGNSDGYWSLQRKYQREAANLPDLQKTGISEHHDDSFEGYHSAGPDTTTPTTIAGSILDPTHALPAAS